MKNLAKKLIWFYNHLEEYLLVICLAVMVVVIFAQVVMRYCFNSSLVWSEELARVLFIWVSWLGISYGQKKYEHITVNMFVDKLRGGVKKAVTLIAHLCSIAILVTFAIQGVTVVSEVMNIGSHTPALDIPKWLLYAAVPVSCGLMTIRVASDIARMFMKPLQGVK